jgi:hypothetical protein
MSKETFTEIPRTFTGENPFNKTMSKELTAIDWLINYMPEDYRLSIPYDFVEQAKAIEKQQIIDAYDESIIDYLNRNAGEFSEPKNGEDYYNQKYKP